MNIKIIIKAKIFKILPKHLPNREPYIYLSQAQISKCNHSILSHFIPYLPCWIPQRIISAELGYGWRGINNALDYIAPINSYVWATEFENIHPYWKFDEPSFTENDVLYNNSKEYYEKNKSQYLKVDDETMYKALYNKFTGSNEQQKLLRDLLLSTYPHQLLSMAEDSYWSITNQGCGDNKLAILLMILRNNLYF